MSNKIIERLSPSLIVSIPVILSAIVHSSILSNYFDNDDFLHLYAAANSGFLEFVIAPHGGHILGTFYSIFYLLYKTFVLNAQLYFVVVLITHLVNVLLIFRIIRLFTGCQYLPIFGASLWGMCPVNQGALGYLSVYGQVLAGTWLLLIVYDLVRIDKEVMITSKRTIIKWYVLLVAAATSFGIGLAVASTFPLFVWLFLAGRSSRMRISLSLLPLVLLIPAIYILQYKAAAGLLGNPIRPPFGLYLNPSLWLEMIKMVLGLISTGISALLLGPFATISQGRIVTSPIPGLASSNTLIIFSIVSIAFWIGLGWAFAKTSQRNRCQLLSFILVVFAVYGIIAVGRTGAYIGWKIPYPDRVTLARYHYVGLLFISLLFCFIIAEIRTYHLRSNWKIDFFLVAWLSIIFIPSIIVARLVTNPSEENRAEYNQVIADIRRQVHQHPANTTVYIENTRLDFITRYFPNPTMLPGIAALFIITYPENRIDGRNILFIERNQNVVNAVKKLKGTRICDVIVSPDLSPRL